MREMVTRGARSLNECYLIGCLPAESKYTCKDEIVQIPDCFCFWALLQLHTDMCLFFPFLSERINLGCLPVSRYSYYSCLALVPTLLRSIKPILCMYLWECWWLRIQEFAETINWLIVQPCNSSLSSPTILAFIPSALASNFALRHHSQESHLASAYPTPSSH